MIKALGFGIAVAASGGRDANELTKSHRSHAGPYARRLDAEADASFFAALEDRYAALNASDAAAVPASRAAFARPLIHAAERLLSEAIEAVPCPAIHRPRGAGTGGERILGAAAQFQERVQRPTGNLCREGG